MPTNKTCQIKKVVNIGRGYLMTPSKKTLEKATSKYDRRRKFGLCKRGQKLESYS
jgi:hypothetical protein